MGFPKDFGSSPEHPSENGVVVYTTSGCTRCDMLKKWFLVMRNFVVLSAPAIEVEGVVYTENQIFESNGLINSQISKLFEGI